MDDAAWEKVVSTLRDVAELEEESLARLRPMVTLRRLKRGNFLLRAGDSAQIAAVVLDGVLREYFCDDQGREHTRGFAYERTLAGSLSDLIGSNPATMNLEALTDVALAQVPWTHFDRLTQVDPAWNHFVRKLAEHAYARKAERERQLLASSARDRYERFVAERSDLLTRIPLRHIASYLGMSPEHLSRLRRVS